MHGISEAGLFANVEGENALPVWHRCCNGASLAGVADQTVGWRESIDACLASLPYILSAYVQFSC